MMRWAIQCLEDELAKTLDKAAEIDRELRALRELQTTTPRDPSDGFPPAVQVPVSPAAPARPAGDTGEVVDVGPDAAPPGGIERPTPTEPDAGDELCLHCLRTFATKRGLNKHITSAHPIKARKFDAQKARDAAAAA